MIASELIVDLLPPIKPSEKCSKALLWMNEFKVAHLPVVEGTNFHGLISEEDIMDSNFYDESLRESKIQLMHVFAYGYQHIFDVMKLMSDNSLTVVPVLDKNEKYLGSTTLAHLMNLIANTTSIKEPGGVIVLLVNSNDYSLAQISQIVESNNAKILSSYITSSPDSTMMEVTLKINKKDLGGILQTFSRYDYKVVQTYQKNEDYDEMQNRYDHLMKMLDL